MNLQYCFIFLLMLNTSRRKQYGKQKNDKKPREEKNASAENRLTFRTEQLIIITRKCRQPVSAAASWRERADRPAPAE